MKRAIHSEETTRAASAPAGTTHAEVLLLLNEAGLRVVPLPASGQLLVGRGEDADVVVADQLMSRRHARLAINGVCEVQDLHSANGTFVRGARLDAGASVTIKPGEPVELGSTLLVLRQRFAALLPVESTSSAPLEPPRLGRAMNTLLATADRVAASQLSVLILGETGVGKDVLAERIHRRSPRSAQPFLRVNCAALSTSLLESELFGHEKGAFTGAASASPGLLRSASGGTVFLDEIGELPAELQAKLLLVIERREVLAVGAVRPRPIDVRFVSATNSNLTRKMATGEFRSDLYFRLNGLTLTLPPLRERVSEIAGLARRVASEAARALGQPNPGFSPAVLTTLEGYRWPGNVRELRTVVERALVLGDGSEIDVADVMLASQGDEPESDADASSGVHPSGGSELQVISRTLARFGGNQSRTAKELGMARNTLLSRMDKYGLARPTKER